MTEEELRLLIESNLAADGKIIEVYQLLKLQNKHVEMMNIAQSLFSTFLSEPVGRTSLKVVESVANVYGFMIGLSTTHDVSLLTGLVNYDTGYYLYDATDLDSLTVAADRFARARSLLPESHRKRLRSGKLECQTRLRIVRMGPLVPNQLRLTHCEKVEDLCLEIQPELKEKSLEWGWFVQFHADSFFLRSQFSDDPVPDLLNARTLYLKLDGAEQEDGEFVRLLSNLGIVAARLGDLNQDPAGYYPAAVKYFEAAYAATPESNVASRNNTLQNLERVHEQIRNWHLFGPGGEL